MGFYINHPEMEKEEWLNKNASPAVFSEELFKNCPAVCRVIVLVQNPMFSAAMIVWCEREWNRVVYSRKNGDTRPMKCFVAPWEEIKKVCPQCPEEE